MRIGFDVSATCHEKTGCTWYADTLARSMVEQHPEDEFVLYHHFGRNCFDQAGRGTTIDRDRVSQPYLSWDAKQGRSEWTRIAQGNSTVAGAPDIVQANFFECPRIAGVPVVYVVYDLAFWVCPEFLTGAHYVSCTRGICEAIVNASAFIFISEHTRQEFERHFPGWMSRNRRPHRVIHLAAREGARQPGHAGAFGRDYWLFVGSIEPRKNLLTLLQAHEIYRGFSRNPRKLLLAGGKGWCSDAVHDEIALRQAAGSAEYLGYVDEERMPELYAGALGVLYPSYYEGFGLPILEAMHRGVPVICSRATSHPEVGGDDVVYFDASSPHELASKMLELEEDEKLRSSLALRGKARADQFSWQRVAAETVDFYAEVLAAYRASGATGQGGPPPAGVKSPAVA